MPDAPTTRLGLYKSLSDGSEDVNYTQDIGQNWDKVDAAAGFQVVTSSTRPSSPYSGKGIAESDTTYRTYFSNGTAPASASWVQIPNSSSTFNADLDLTSGKQVNIGASSSTASLAVLTAAAGDDILSTRITGDTQSRYLVEADGATYWGPGGSTAPDTKLYRSAADTLRTDDSFIVGTNLTVSGNTTITGNLTVSGVGQVLFAYKTIDTPRSTATFSDDPHLTFSAAANAVYEVEGFLHYYTTDATNADINVDFTTPASAAGIWTGFGQPTGATTVDGTVRTMSTAIDGSRNYGALTDTVNPLVIVIRGTLVTTTAGTYALSWARTGGSGTLTLLAYSNMKLTRVA